MVHLHSNLFRCMASLFVSLQIISFCYIRKGFQRKESGRQADKNFQAFKFFFVGVI
jgi:hypothetical protein